MNVDDHLDFATLEYALELIGGRWTLLIVRTLLIGPQRFTDLLIGLPGISTNLLTQRLKALEQQGLVRRRTLPRPLSSTVYELTATGHALEHVVQELGAWGRLVLPDAGGDRQVNRAEAHR